MKYKLLLSLLTIPFLFSCDDDEGMTFDNQYNMELFEVNEFPDQRRVNVLFQVTDGQTGVADLTADDFIVYENGRQVTSESKVEIDPQAIPYTMKTVLLLDISSSVSSFIDQLKSAAIALVEQKLVNQEIAIYVFDKNTRLLQDFTSNRGELIRQIESIPETDLESSTNLYGAIIDVTSENNFDWIETYSIDSIQERNLLVFTDGRHTADPDIQLDSALNSIGDKNVYVAALQSDDLDETALTQIATRNYFRANNAADIEDAFSSLLTDIDNLSRSLYYLYYTSPITNPSARMNDLDIVLRDNRTGEGFSISTTFNSEGFE
jgi:hypothetical protein